MKKTIKIKIGGIVFHIDDDAYDILKVYLDSLSRYFSRLEDGKEVMDDIETRIAEIFQQNTGIQKEVITIDDVNRMITIMGEAKDIIDEDEPETTRNQTSSRSTGRLYRDPDNGILGGVCSGLGAYFNIDPLLFQIIFLISLLAYGLGLVYVILWIVLPKAVTPSQKLEMKGENINIKNIEKSVREEYEQVKHNLNSPRVSETFNNIGNALLIFFKAIGNIILIFLKIILIIIGGALILAGFIALLSFLGVLIFGNSLFFQDIIDTPGFYLPHLLPVFTDPKYVPFVMIALILAVVIPLITLIYGGIKLIFRFKVKDKAIGVFALILWLIALGGLITIGTFESIHYTSSGRVTKTYKLNPVNGNTIILETGELPENAGNKDFLSFEFDNNDGIYRDAETGTIFGKPGFTVKESKSGELKLEIIKKSRGRNSGKAWEHALDLGYYWNQRDSLIVLDPYFKLAEGKRWRNPSVHVTLWLPEGYKVYFDEDMTRVIDFIPNVNGTRNYDMVDKTWIMTEDGLKEWIPVKDSLLIPAETEMTDTIEVQ
jgi:phage shock protein PspC (stress-responsive transcriptional regulator)